MATHRLLRFCLSVCEITRALLDAGLTEQTVPLYGFWLRFSQEISFNFRSVITIVSSHRVVVGLRF